MGPKSVKNEVWEGLGEPWGALGGHLGPKVPRSHKKVVRWTPPPLGDPILRLFRSLFGGRFRYVFEEALGHHFCRLGVEK